MVSPSESRLPSLKTYEDEVISRRIPVWRIEDLTTGGLEAEILHDGQIYRLRITANRKLILTK